MATKAELLAAASRYHSLAVTADRLAGEREYPGALQVARESLAFAWDAVSYLRRYEKVEKPTLSSVELILRLAPPLFSVESLEAVEEWLATAKRPEKTLYGSLRDELAVARRMMNLAAQLWDAGEFDEEQSGGPADRGDGEPLVEVWSRMGVVALQRWGYHHVSSPVGLVIARCSNCGEECLELLTDILDPMQCPRCRRRTEFTLLRRIYPNRED